MVPLDQGELMEKGKYNVIYTERENGDKYERVFKKI